MLGRFSNTNEIVARKLGIKEERVSKVMSFFVEELNQELKSCQHPFVYVRGLGTFTLVVSAIETRLRNTIHVYRHAKKDPPSRKSEENLLSLRKTIFELFTIRRLIKNKRKELKTLRNARKAEHDSAGELLQNDRKKQKPLREEKQHL